MNDADLDEAMESGDLRETLEAKKPDKGYWSEAMCTKRHMLGILASNLAWDASTEKELDAGILSLIGHFFDPPGVNLNNPYARGIWIEAHLQGLVPPFAGQIAHTERVAANLRRIIRAVGDDPTYGVPKRKRTKPTKQQNAAILQLVQAHTDPSHESKANGKDNSGEQENDD